MDYLVRVTLRGLVLKWNQQAQPLRLSNLSLPFPIVPTHPPLMPSFADLPELTSHDNEENWAERANEKESGFLWATPKKRVSAMKRLRRKFGHQDWGSPLLKAKTNLRICDTCGHHYEAKHLCGNCYKRIMKETEEIRAKAEERLGHDPEDRRVVVIYDNEKFSDQRFVDDSVVVEMPKPRPSWFSSNLLQSTSLKRNDDAKEVVAQKAKPQIFQEDK